MQQNDNGGLAMSREKKKINNFFFNFNKDNFGILLKMGAKKIS